MNGRLNDDCKSSAVRMTRRAVNAIRVLTGLYVIHAAACLAVAPRERLTVSNLIGVSIVFTIVEFLLCWSERKVRRDGRLALAIVMTSIFMGGSALSAVLSVLPGGPRSGWFTSLQFVINGWSLLTLLLLLILHYRRKDAASGI